MTTPVSIVIPCLDDRDLLRKHLPRLLEECLRRGVKDEVIIVDDTGEDVLASWLNEEFPGVRCLSHTKNVGFANSMYDGFAQATYPLVFAMNPDVLVRAGFLDPLVACLEEDVHAAVPRVLLGGESDKIESLVFLEMSAGELHLRQPGLTQPEDGSAPLPIEPVPVTFAIGGAALFRRDVFLERGGFDELYEPFYWEDIDFGWTSWRCGGKVLYQPASIVEHHHRGTIGRVVPPDLVRAAIEKNRLLFHWKHIDDAESMEEHQSFLYRLAIDAWLGDRREELVWLALALEETEAVMAARKKLPKGRAFKDVLQALRADHSGS